MPKNITEFPRNARKYDQSSNDRSKWLITVWLTINRLELIVSRNDHLFSEQMKSNAWVELDSSIPLTLITESHTDIYAHVRYTVYGTECRYRISGHLFNWFFIIHPHAWSVDSVEYIELINWFEMKFNYWKQPF